MGYRSVLITEDNDITWPEWFVKKYSSYIRFSPGNCGLFSAKYEFKLYGDTLSLLPKDMQKVLADGNIKMSLRFVALHEDGEIVRCTVSKNNIQNENAIEFEITETLWN